MSADSRKMISDKLRDIGYAYNSKFDIILNGPRVTWVDAEFVQILSLMLDEISSLIGENINLRIRLQNLERTIAKHNLG